MISSPAHSQPSVAFGIIASIVGIAIVAFGVKTIWKREIKAGPRGGPYQELRGRNAIEMGLGIVLFGLWFFVPAVLGLIKLYRSH